MGLLDAFNSPEMGLAMGLLNAGGASSHPVSLGQGIAQGYQGFQQAQENNQQRAAREQQMQMHTLQMKQMQDAQKLIEDRKVQLVSYIKDLQATNPAEAAKYQQAVSLGIPLEKVWEQANKDPKFAYHEGNIYNESKVGQGGAPTMVGVIPQKPVAVNLGGSTSFVLPTVGMNLQHTPTTSDLRSDKRLAFDQEQANAGGLQGMTPEAIDMAGARYRMDGTLPPMGMGKQGAQGRVAILNNAAAGDKAAGTLPEDARAAQLGNKANAAALSKLQQQQTMVGAFEKNAVKNAEMALALSNDVSRTGIPIVNAWVQAGQKAVAGDPKLAQFHAANETFVNEYAKIMSGSMGNTAVSDSARAHAHSLLSTAQTKETYAAVISTLRAEMKNRMQGFEEEKAALRDSMKLPSAKSGNVVDFSSLK